MSFDCGQGHVDWDQLHHVSILLHERGDNCVRCFGNITPGTLLAALGLDPGRLGWPDRFARQYKRGPSWLEAYGSHLAWSCYHPFLCTHVSLNIQKLEMLTVTYPSSLLTCGNWSSYGLRMKATFTTSLAGAWF